MPHDVITIPPTAVIDAELAALLTADLTMAKTLVTEELAESTRQGYRRDLRGFAAWCASRGIALQRDVEGRLLTPVSSTTLAAYIGSLVGEGTIRSGTLSRRVAAISYACKIAGHLDPTREPAVRSALKAARRRLGVAPIYRKAAITPDMLVAMLELCPQTLAGKRDRALLSIGWALALRRGELVALDINDVQHVPGGIHVIIRKSKTDQLAAGTTIAVPDRVRDRIRPVRELKTWLRAAKIKSGPLFVRVNKSGRLEARLDGGTVGQLVKRYAQLAGFDVETLGGHSLRIGFATSAAAVGASASEMANVTRHTSMDTLFSYIRSRDLLKDYPAAILR